MTFDLKQPITDLNDSPLLDKGQMLNFNSPQTVTVGDEQMEGVSAVITETQELTFRKAIQKALLTDIPADHPQFKEMPDKHERTMLAMRLIADSDVNLKSEDITVIKAATKVSSPAIQYMRIVALLEPEEKPKKKAED